MNKICIQTELATTKEIIQLACFYEREHKLMFTEMYQIIIAKMPFALL